MAEVQVTAGSRWYRRPRWIVTMSAGAVLLVGGAFFVVAWSHRGAEEASVDEALRRFREQGQGGEAAFLRPAAGVYTYAGTGTEKLSLLSTSQKWGPHLPATVTRDAHDCWKYKIEFSTNHWVETRYCPEKRELHEVGNRTFQSFDFVAFTADDLNVFTCDPPGEVIRVDAEPGDTWRQKCEGRSTERKTHVTSTGPNTFLGIETVEVAGEEVRAYHYRLERELTGDQKGDESADTWYAVRDGLPLKSEREVRVKSPSPIGDVTYTERGTYTLTSLEPRR